MKHVILALLFMAASWYLGTQVQQHQFPQILGGFVFLSVLGLWMYREAGERRQVLFWVAIGLAARAVLLFSEPQLSDDYFRFIWDGRLAIQGIHPFAALPSEYAAQGFPAPGNDAALYAQLNSPEYHTVYPPVAQAVFAVACYIFPDSIAGSVFVMKLFLWLMELGTCWLLWRLLMYWQLPLRNLLLYALHPLAIIEITGNLHFEGAMIFFFLLALWWAVRGRMALSAAGLALSFASKMLSLLALPFLLRILGWKRTLLYGLVFAGVTALLFAPLIDLEVLRHFGASLNLYFRQFEFNASVYYIARWIGYEISGHNRIAYIGPALAAVAALSMLAIALWPRRNELKQWPGFLLAAITIYLFLGTTVHPWYLCLPLALSVLCRYKYAALWAVVAVLSYHKYATPDQEERLWVTAIEYLIVIGMMLWEWRRHRISAASERARTLAGN